MMENFFTIPWARLSILLLLIYLIIAILTWFYGDRILFPVPGKSTYSPADVSFYVTLAGDQKIACIRRGNTENPLHTIIYSHGNGEDLGNLKSFMARWGSGNAEIIAYDYPGYGESDGKPSEQGCYDAISAVYKKTVYEFGRNPSSIIVWGRSLGTGPSFYLSVNEKIGGLILETPFLSAYRSVTGVTILPWDRFRNIEFASQVSCPSLVIHGTMDEVVPYSQGVQIFKQLAEPKEFFEVLDAEHNNLMEIGGDRYRKKVSDFIMSIEG